MGILYENIFENVVYEMAAILPRPQSVIQVKCHKADISALQMNTHLMNTNLQSCQSHPLGKQSQYFVAETNAPVET